MNRVGKQLPETHKKKLNAAMVNVIILVAHAACQMAAMTKFSTLETVIFEKAPTYLQSKWQRGRS